MKLSTEDFIQHIQQDVNTVRTFIQDCQNLDTAILNERPSNDSWSVLECVDHMNKSTRLYIDQLYLDEIGNAAKEHHVKLRWFAKWFANTMRPKDNKIKWKMKTMDVFVPGSDHDSSILEEFNSTLSHVEALLKAGAQSSFNRHKIVTALGPLLKFKFGEGLWFIMAHNLRHVQQGRNILDKQIV